MKKSRFVLCLALSSLAISGIAHADDTKPAKAATAAAAGSESKTDAKGDPSAVSAALKRTDRTHVKELADATGSDGTALTVGGAKGDGTVSASGRGDLAAIHGATKEQASTVAGSARDVAVRESSVDHAPRPQASPRQLRRMNVERVVAQIAPAIQSCADATGKVVAPSNAILVADVNASGAVDGATVASAAGVAPEVVACAVDQVKNTKFGAPGGAGATVAVPVSFAVARAR